MYVINKYGFALKVYFKAIARVRQHRYFLYSKKKTFFAVYYLYDCTTAKRNVNVRR